ncbi:MAG: Maf family protein [Tepidisphaeraceae bacterium]|jgi:septum formation protein
MRIRLILASASPQRQRLLREAGYDFLTQSADVDESSLIRNLSPADAALRIAVAKAQAVTGRFPDDVVLAADTIVALGGTILGKPADAADARRILSQLSGTTHQVITGVAVVQIRSALCLIEQVTSTVEMKPLSREEIDAYIASDQWQGKAGAYGIQDPDPFVRRTAGCMTNIVGLPMTTTRRLLGQAGVGHAE